MPAILKAPGIRAGNKIAIVSPASSEEAERFEAAGKYFRGKGFHPIEGNFARGTYGYFAGSDVERAGDFNRFLRDDKAAAIFAARGGYGCSRILSLIDYKAASEHPKIIVGGSDLTALLWAIQTKTGLITFYGPMALQAGKGLDEYSETALWNAATGKMKGAYRPPAGRTLIPMKPGKAEGRLIGGCLSLVVSLLGTEYFGDISGKILFLEEIGEKPFRIDRMLTHLRNAGVFHKINGLLLGDFHKCWEDEDTESFSLEEMVQQILGDLKLPVIAGSITMAGWRALWNFWRRQFILIRQAMAPDGTLINAAVVTEHCSVTTKKLILIYTAEYRDSATLSLYFSLEHLSAYFDFRLI